MPPLAWNHSTSFSRLQLDHRSSTHGGIWYLCPGLGHGTKNFISRVSSFTQAARIHGGNIALWNWLSPEVYVERTFPYLAPGNRKHPVACVNHYYIAQFIFGIGNYKMFHQDSPPVVNQMMGSDFLVSGLRGNGIIGSGRSLLNGQHLMDGVWGRDQSPGTSYIGKHS